MYEEFDKQELERELLYAKDAIFRMIGQFHHASNLFDNGDLYIYNYCESALEAVFNVLGIEEDYIPLMAFCKMWENNNRAIWALNIPDEPFGGIAADIYYKCFEDDYKQWLRDINEVEDEDS